MSSHEKQAVIMRLENISKSFYSVQVLRDIHLKLHQGEVLGLVGENGAGKSTLMNILGGIYQPDTGSMELFDKPYKPSSARTATSNGIAFIHQELNLFTNLTVAENMFIDNFPTGPLGAIQYKRIQKASQEYMKEFGLDVRSGAKVDQLPMGSRQMVEIAKALMKNAKIIIFDEPTTSLSTREKEKLFVTIREIRARGVGVIYISHILEDVLELCDNIAVLRDGALVQYDATQNYTKESLIRHMVGRELTQIYPSVEKTQGPVALSVRGLGCSGFVRNVNLELHQGEILGMFGLMGAGRTELLRAIFGLDPLEGGGIEVFGEKIAKPSPQKCIARGMAFITENRRDEGLLMPRSVNKNLMMVKAQDLAGRFGVVDKKREADLAKKEIDTLHIKVNDPARQSASNLSGGNQQKAVMGKWLAKEPRIFLVDEPTHGVDVGAKYEIYKLIMEMAKKQAAVLVVSSEMGELMGICDRIMVLSSGKVTGVVDKPDFNQERILKLAL